MHEKGVGLFKEVFITDMMIAFTRKNQIYKIINFFQVNFL